MSSPDQNPEQCKVIANCEYCTQPSDSSPWLALEYRTFFHEDCQACSNYAFAIGACESMRLSESQLCLWCRHARIGHLFYCIPSAAKQKLFEYVFHPEHKFKRQLDPNCVICRAVDILSIYSSILHVEVADGAGVMISMDAGPQTNYRFQDTYNKSRHSVADVLILAPGARTAFNLTIKPRFDQWQTVKSLLSSCHSPKGQHKSKDDEAPWDQGKEPPSHQYCKIPSRSQLPRPFRLIDVKNKRIVEYGTLDLRRVPEYLALSYVWGKVSQHVTSSLVRSNRRSLLASLDEMAIPATVRDAIAVCRELGESFLWVDRFCIIQDDEEDKASQLQAMSSIYSAAKLTLMAAAGDNMDHGLVGVSRDRTPIVGTVSGLQIHLLPSTLQSIELTTWASRGWTYQENELAIRRLIFTDQHVVFACRALVDVEHMLDSGFPHEVYEYEKPSGAFLRFCAYREHLDSYRVKTLSYMSDNINAFQGILTDLFPGTEATFYGLPAESLHQALQWHSTSLSRAAPHRPARPALFLTEDDRKVLSRFPSWSWASRQGTVHYP